MAEQKNADMYISIGAENSGNVKQGGTIYLNVRFGNAGQDSIVKNSLDVTIPMPPNAKIVGVAKRHKDIDGVPSAWEDVEMKLDKKGLGNTAKITNKRGYGPLDLSAFSIKVQAGRKKGQGLIGANVAYKFEKNPLLGDQYNMIQGNVDPANDNSSTSITVN